MAPRYVTPAKSHEEVTGRLVGFEPQGGVRLKPTA